MYRLALLCFVLAAATAFAQDYTPYAHARKTDHPTALDRYVAKPDSNYAWELARTEKEEGVTNYTLKLTSQQWRSFSEVTQPVWWHWLTISVPDAIEHPTALLFIDGGSNRRGDNPPAADGDFKRIARNTRTITATLYQVPNQPLTFTDMKGWGRSEDSLIAYTWWKFYMTGDEEWPLRLPMTKAAVRAMDAIQEFCASPDAGAKKVEDFMVCGGSKRGWTTWTTAIVDERVRAIAPCAIDVVNVWEGLKHQYASLGHWSAFMGDYLALGLQNWLNTPEAKALAEIEDPQYYLDRLQMPKFIMMGANDQFFVPDLSGNWWSQLPGPKWLRQVPNAGHPIDSTAVPTVEAYYTHVVDGSPMPNYDFAFEPNNVVTVTLKPSENGEILQPISAKLWQAYNPQTRDFRGSKATYEASDLAPVEPNRYRVQVAPKETGYIAYIIELTYAGPTEDTPLRVTSGCRVSPEPTKFEYQPPAELPKGFIGKQQMATVR